MNITSINSYVPQHDHEITTPVIRPASRSSGRQVSLSDSDKTTVQSHRGKDRITSGTAPEISTRQIKNAASGGTGQVVKTVLGGLTLACVVGLVSSAPTNITSTTSSALTENKSATDTLQDTAINSTVSSLLSTISPDQRLQILEKGMESLTSLVDKLQATMDTQQSEIDRLRTGISLLEFRDNETRDLALAAFMLVVAVYWIALCICQCRSR